MANTTGNYNSNICSGEALKELSDFDLIVSDLKREVERFKSTRYSLFSKVINLKDFRNLCKSSSDNDTKEVCNDNDFLNKFRNLIDDLRECNNDLDSLNNELQKIVG